MIFVVPNLVGKTLGRYQILRHLASGGMADVYLAQFSGLEGFVRHVVLKRIRAKDAHDEGYVKMFLDEARLAATLHHQNVVQVHDVGQTDDEYYLSMEYIHGKDARALLMKAVDRTEHVPLEHVVAIMTSAAAGLHHAHEQLGPDRTPLGLVHRDVSPSNILVGYDGSVKVADFGIAKAAQRSVETHSGTLKGKVAYLSPEQCRGKPADRRSDVFGLGIVLYELATARRLFKADSEYLSMSAIVGGVIPPPSKFRPDLPPGLETIILKALANDPDARYPTANTFRIALDELAVTAGLRMSTTTLADYMGQLFGSPVEPWLTDDIAEEEQRDREISGSGLVRPSSSISDLDIDPDAPIAVARRKRAITSVPAVDDTEAPVLVSRSTLPTMAAVKVDDEPVRSNRRLVWLGAGLAAAALGIVGLVKLASGSSSNVAAAPTQIVTPTPAPPATAPTPPTPQRTPEPPPAVTPAPPPPVAAKPAPAKPKLVRPKIVKKSIPTPDPEWDRTSLFPK